MTSKSPLPDLHIPNIPAVGLIELPKNRIEKWFLKGGRTDGAAHHAHDYPWYKVLWLTGVDYFSTLGYQPGIALLAAGALSPLATIILVLVTLFGALPVYMQVAKRSYAGQGSIAMLENLLKGWYGKVFVLILIGFATTDFVITMTLSAADATQHIIENPFVHSYLGESARIPLTLGLLGLLAIVFLLGFSEAINVATFITIPYLLLNLVVLAVAFQDIANHQEYLPRWSEALRLRGDTSWLLVLALLNFPKLALGLSGFETGVTVMPLVSNRGCPDGDQKPTGRIRGTKNLLMAAALIMSFFLILSSFATTLLIRPEDYEAGGKAYGRALSFLAHRYFGEEFGTVYDVSTITILWFAGASAMAGLLNLIPRYLPRFGMAPRWVSYTRPLVLLLFAINIVVTVIFKADVEAQGGAYATGVLVLILSAAIAVAIAFRREAAEVKSVSEVRRKQLTSTLFWGIAVIFTYTLVDNVIERSDGVIISGVFIAMILISSTVSRYLRSKEFRVERMMFIDEDSCSLWSEIVGKKVNLIPLKHTDPTARVRKIKEIRKYYNVQGPLAFVHVHLMDNRSEFLAPLKLQIRRGEDGYNLHLFGAPAVANSLAYLSELIDPVSLFLGLTRKNLVEQAIRYLFLGEGEVGLSVYQILLNHWQWTPEDDVRPLIFLMSE